jgi:hypothetical protein
MWQTSILEWFVGALYQWQALGVSAPKLMMKDDDDCNF